MRRVEGGGGEQMKAEGKIDFGTEQETITVFYIFPSKLSINLHFSSCTCLRVHAAKGTHFANSNLSLRQLIIFLPYQTPYTNTIYCQDCSLVTNITKTIT